AVDLLHGAVDDMRRGAPDVGAGAVAFDVRNDRIVGDGELSVAVVDASPGLRLVHGRRSLPHDNVRRSQESIFVGKQGIFPLPVSRFDLATHAREVITTFQTPDPSGVFSIDSIASSNVARRTSIRISPFV